jgi:hypothetical protein
MLIEIGMLIMSGANPNIKDIPTVHTTSSCTAVLPTLPNISNHTIGAQIMLEIAISKHKYLAIGFLKHLPIVPEIMIEIRQTKK